MAIDKEERTVENADLNSGTFEMSEGASWALVLDLGKKALVVEVLDIIEDQGPRGAFTHFK